MAIIAPEHTYSTLFFIIIMKKRAKYVYSEAMKRIEVLYRLDPFYWMKILVRTELRITLTLQSLTELR